jgi:hypothetical protein
MKNASQLRRALLAAFAAIAVLRGIVLVAHDPLLALANNYDQIRELACIDVGPWRPGVNAGVANPAAPLTRFSFQPLSRDACVWTSDLVFTMPVAMIWRGAEALGASNVHSVRWLSAFRLLLWFVVAIWATRAFLHAGRPDIAIAHLAWLAIVGMDPANTIYLATFYSEPAAIFGLYLAVVAAFVALLRPTALALLLTAVGALVLAGSKLQHLMLPMLAGACVLAAGDQASKKAALALFVGGVLGCAIQIGNQTRDTWMNRDMAMINRMDYVLTVLLEDTSDRGRVARELALDEECLSHRGKNVFEIQMPSEKACPNNAEWRKATMWWLMISDPAAMVRAAARVPSLLLPWLPESLGVVEGEDHGRLPIASPSIASLLGKSASAAAILLLTPWLVLITYIRRGFPRARAFALVCAVGSAGVCAVALLGDGTVDFGKHAHLAPSLALGSLLAPLAGFVGRLIRESASKE